VQRWTADGEASRPAPVDRGFAIARVAAPLEDKGAYDKILVEEALRAQRDGR